MRGEKEEVVVEGSCETAAPGCGAPAAVTADTADALLPLVLKLVRPPERRLEGTGGAGMEPSPAATGSSLETDTAAAAVEGTSFSEPARGRGTEEGVESEAADTPLPLLELELMGVGERVVGLRSGGVADTGGKFPHAGKDAMKVGFSIILYITA